MKSKSTPMETEVDEPMEETIMEPDIGVLSNNLNKKVKIDELENEEEQELQNGTRYFIHNETGYEQIKTEEILQITCIQVETLIPVDYIYKNVTLPLIFVNTCVNGISLKEQLSLVKDDIKEVIRHFVNGNVTPNDTTITKFFQSNPGTMIYSPQLVKTVVSLQYCDLDNMQFTQRKEIPSPSRIRTSHEE